MQISVQSSYIALLSEIVIWKNLKRWEREKEEIWWWWKYIEIETVCTARKMSQPCFLKLSKLTTDIKYYLAGYEV